MASTADAHLLSPQFGCWRQYISLAVTKHCSFKVLSTPPSKNALTKTSGVGEGSRLSLDIEAVFAQCQLICSSPSLHRHGFLHLPFTLLSRSHSPFQSFHSHTSPNSLPFHFPSKPLALYLLWLLVHTSHSIFFPQGNEGPPHPCSEGSVGASQLSAVQLSARLDPAYLPKTHTLA